MYQQNVIKNHLKTLRLEMLWELRSNILPFWTNKMQDENRGGFYGQIKGNDIVQIDAAKGAILNARILWTFSSAFRILNNKKYLKVAERAKDYLLNYFVDKKYGGIYWSLDCKGEPLDTKKQIYALGFLIYGLSEYYRITNDEEVLTKAIEIFYTIEKYSFDQKFGGYYEAFTRDWQEIHDMRLSEKDINEKKTMNTHLHILESYTNLYRVWKDAELAKQMHGLIEIFSSKILNENTGHLNLFFSDEWEVRSEIISYGHDIEASWLIYEAAIVLGEEDLIDRIKHLTKNMADAAAEGLQYDGSIIYEFNKATSHYDNDRHWWVQAEAVVGFYNMYQCFNDETSLKRSLNCWNYIKSHLIDKKNGEWFWSLKTDGSVNQFDDKAGFWKCPYHNGRMCIELIERISV